MLQEDSGISRNYDELAGRQGKCGLRQQVIKSCEKGRNQYAYLPLGNSSITTEMTNEVITSRNVGEVKAEGLARFLVDDNKSELAAVASSIDAPGIGVGISKIDLGGLVTEIGTITEFQA